jgi:hypothetical protein
VSSCSTWASVLIVQSLRVVAPPRCHSVRLSTSSELRSPSSAFSEVKLPVSVCWLCVGCVCRMVADAVAGLGRLDIAINNAGEPRTCSRLLFY